MAKILVLGATGFLGRHLIKRLKDNQVTYLIRRNSKNTHIKGKNLTYGDVANLDDLIKASKGQDIIINLSTPNTQNDKINKKVIVDGAKNIISAAKKNKIKKIIHLSSAAIYRKNKDSYGESKKEADELFLNSGLNTVILRPTMIYGRGGYAAEKLFASVIKIPFFVLVAGNGKNKIQPIYVNDAVSAIISSINFEPNGVKSFALGGGYPIGYDEFVKKILNAIHKKKTIIHIPAILIIWLAKTLNIFFKNLAFNETTIKRMIEEIDIDNEKTLRELKIKITDYDEALSDLFKKHK